VGSHRFERCAVGGQARTAVAGLPRILPPAEVDVLTAALRTHRDRAMVAAMVLGGLRRSKVLGLSLDDLRFAERKVLITGCKGGRQRLISVSGRFFAAVAAYLEAERPPGRAPDRVFLVFKGPHRAGSRYPGRHEDSLVADLHEVISR
jgi:site-specific recombinase XerD